MKKLSLCLAILGLSLGNLAAQTTSCANTTAPAVQSGMSTVEVGGVTTVPAPPMSVAGSGFTHTQFLITKKGTPARDGQGNIDTTGQVLSSVNDVIIGADDDGNFIPFYVSRYGISIAPNDTIELTAIGFNRSQVRTLVQKILNGTIAATGATCCQVLNLTPDARGFCDTLRNVGIVDSNTIEDLSDVLAVFDAFSDRQLSVRGLIASMSMVNSFSGTLPVECGRNDLPICFGVDINARHGYKANAQVVVERMNDVSTFAIFPNPVQDGRLNIFVSTSSSVDLSVTIYNTLGERVMSSQLGSINGEHNQVLSTFNLSAGDRKSVV